MHTSMNAVLPAFLFFFELCLRAASKAELAGADVEPNNLSRSNTVKEHLYFKREPAVSDRMEGMQDALEAFPCHIESARPIDMLFAQLVNCFVCAVHKIWSEDRMK